MRSGDTIHKFQLLATMFRENPDAISRPAMEMLYPMRRFDLLKSYQALVDPWVVLSLIRQESAFNENARSRVGAVGLMQLMPSTARRIAAVSRRQLLEPATNIKIGVKFFSKLLDRFDGDVELSLAAYNAGPEKVDLWKRRYPVSNRLLFMDLMPFRETREYVASIARNYYWYLKLYGNEDFDSRFRAARTSAGRRGFYVFTQFNPLQSPDSAPYHPPLDPSAPAAALPDQLLSPGREPADESRQTQTNPDGSRVALISEEM